MVDPAAAPPEAPPIGRGLSLMSLGRPTALVTIGGVAGQVFAIIRTLFVAAQVGTSPSLDALLVAEVLPVIVAGMIASGLRNAVVPAYLDIAAERGRREASRFVGFLLTWSILIAAVGVAALYLLPGPAISVSGPGLAAPARESALGFLPLLAPILGLSVMWVMLATVCQAERRFVPIAIGLGLNPLCSLVTTVVLWDQLQLRGLALGMTLGYVGTVIFAAVYLSRTGLILRPSLGFERRDLNRFMRHAAPLVLGATVVQFNLLADRAMATLLGAGSVSALNYGQLVVIQSIGSLNTAWMLVLYPSLVQLARPSGGGLGESAERAVRQMVALFLPVAVGAMALAPLGVQVAYKRGAFDAAAVTTTAAVVVAFAPMILLTMIQPVLSGAHNARRRGGLIGFAAVLNAVLNVVLDVVFGLTLGIAGVALSTSVTLVVVASVLAVQLHRWEPGFTLRPILWTMVRALAASLVAGLPIAALVWLWLPALSFAGAAVAMLVLLIVGASVYLAVGSLLRLDELRLALSPLYRRVGRLLGAVR
jgi:Uncharacterized membrane protein, putative virulence factor